MVDVHYDRGLDIWRHEYPTWIETASGEDVSVTATHAGEAGKNHYVTNVFVTTDKAPTQAGALHLEKDGGAIIADLWVGGDLSTTFYNFSFQMPIRWPVGEAAAANMNPLGSGTDNVGVKVAIAGYTAPD